MPIPAIIGLILVLAVVVLLIVRRVWPARHKEPDPGDPGAGENDVGGNTAEGGD